MSETEHFLALEAALNQEQSYAQAQFRNHLRDIPLPQRCADGSALYPLELKQQDFGLGGRPVLTLGYGPKANAEGFQSGQSVSLFSLHQPQEPVAAVVRKVQSDQVQVFLNSPEAPEWLEDGKLGLEMAFDETTFREMLRAVQILKDPQENRTRQLRQILLGLAPARFLPMPTRPDRPGFNPSQQAALDQVLQAEDLALIHGPPGTGKTTTLVACIVAVLQREKQVLVCAPSNTAVDLLARQLSAEGLNVIRLGHPARMQEDVWPLTLDNRLAAHPSAGVLKQMRSQMLQAQKQARRFRRSFGPAERAERQALYAEARSLRSEIQQLEQQMSDSLLDSAQVLACTFVGATQSLMRGRRFETVFIDEAAQALEAACWIPILKAQKVVMAGDHCQLPPTIQNPEARLLANTLFEQAIGHQPRAATLLNTQYRAHAQIMAFSSQWFYNGQLQPDASVAAQCLNPAASPDSPVNLPRLWIDTAGCGYEEQLNPESRSLSNPEEGRLLGRWLTQQLAQPDFPAGPLRIGVIAPYREQVKWLQQELKLVLPAGVTLEINTVDSFQGQEREIICISMVRSNDSGELGFLNDLRRMNVALTRARKQVVIFGDSATLSSHRFYASLLEAVQSEGSWDSAWNWMDFS